MHNSPIPTLPPFPNPCFWAYPLCPSSIKLLCPPPSLVPKPWVRSPEVDHFNSASWIFFKKDLRPGDPRTSDRGLNPDQPAGLRTLVNTAIISHAPSSTPHFCSLPISSESIWCGPLKYCTWPCSVCGTSQYDTLDLCCRSVPLWWIHGENCTII